MPGSLVSSQSWLLVTLVAPIVVSIILGFVILVVKGKTEAAWFTFPMVITPILSQIGTIGTIVWIIVIIIGWFRVRPENKKWSEKKASFWYSIGVIGAVILMVVISALTFYLVLP